MMAVLVFLMVLLIFAAYIAGNLIGYEDCIKTEEKKKGISQFSRCLWNKRF